MNLFLNINKNTIWKKEKKRQLESSGNYIHFVRNYHIPGFLLLLVVVVGVLVLVVVVVVSSF